MKFQSSKNNVTGKKYFISNCMSEFIFLFYNVKLLILFKSDDTFFLA